MALPGKFHAIAVGRPSRPRAGFTLVEVLVAVLLLEVGLLALAAGCAVLIRHMTFLRARVTALDLARNRLETLSAGPCGQEISAESTGTRARETWSARSIPVGARELTDSVTVTAQQRTSTIVLRTRLPC